jgi:1,5-anhydro-D-fructose reductase (1,5-anhydro-D-mannitol-forming)
MISCVIVGAGKMGEIRYASILKRSDVHCIGYFDPKIDFFHGVKRYVEIGDIFSDSAVDSIFICTPNYLNYELTIRALDSGKHVFCEKPPTLTYSEILQIQKSSLYTKKTLMYGLNHRHHSSVRQLKKLLDTGDFGKILWMRGRYGKGVDGNYLKTWRANPKQSGGGILIDQGIHMLDLFLYLVPELEVVHAHLSGTYWEMGVEDNAFVTLVTPDMKVAASLHSTMTQWRHLFSLEIFTEYGYFVLNGLKTSSGTYGDEVLTVAKTQNTIPRVMPEYEQHYCFNENSSWDYELDIFVNSIKQNITPCSGSLDDAIRIMKQLNLAYSFGIN